jgi:hypothetical protein
MIRLSVAFAAIAAASLCCAPRVFAASMTFSGSSGNLAAAAKFELNGTSLTLTLTNTATTVANAPNQVLMGLLFNSPNLTPLTASIAPGSKSVGTFSDLNLYWGYGHIPVSGYSSVLEASGAVSGLGHSNFNGTKSSLQGADGGIINAPPGVGTNKGFLNQKPFVQNAAIFQFMTPSGFSLSDLGSKVVFLYGTSLTEPRFEGTGGPILEPNVRLVPEPASACLFAIGLAGFAGRTWRMKRRRTISARV